MSGHCVLNKFNEVLKIVLKFNTPGAFKAMCKHATGVCVRDTNGNALCQHDPGTPKRHIVWNSNISHLSH